MLCLLCPASFQSASAAIESPAAPEAAGAVRRITLPHLEPQMPVAPGHDDFMRACVACHSPRYVTMQPAFSRRQWENTVRKMINAYGAPADEAQFTKIVDYLVAIDGDEPRPKTRQGSYDDDESGTGPSVHLPEATESAPELELAADAQDQESKARRGAEIFKEDCAGCHGDEGRGHGFVSQVLWPEPANLTAARFSDEFLRQTLWNGVRGAPMPSWRKLPLRDLSALVAYVESLHSTAESSTIAPDSLARGGALFIRNCAPCHGAMGDGKSVVSAALSPPPTNFKIIQPDFDFIQKVLQDGIPGTSMPVWKDHLSEADCAALAGYVRSLYETPGKK